MPVLNLPSKLEHPCFTLCTNVDHPSRDKMPVVTLLFSQKPSLVLFLPSSACQSPETEGPENSYTKS